MSLSWRWRISALAGLAIWSTAAGSWTLTHEEDFSRASGFDTRFWCVETGMHRNQERQYYTDQNFRVEQGALRIEARRERMPNPARRPGARDWAQSQREAAYTSGSLVSCQPLRFARIEVRARIPAGLGVWPAIWLLGIAPGQYGEIDFMEHVGKHPDTMFATIHYGSRAARRKQRSTWRILPGLAGQWHSYQLEWTPDRIAVAIDGQPLLVMNPDDARAGDADPLRQPMQLRINLALGGTWAGPIDEAALPARFDIASIRIWGWDGKASAPEPFAAAGSPGIAPLPRAQAAAAVEVETPSMLRRSPGGMAVGASDAETVVPNEMPAAAPEQGSGDAPPVFRWSR
ncbi:Glycosyl hydrolases family 16 [Noviherbaspirillum humi]|uniref:Glycosyl hydrolases family 16 n=1 Tax=Noviherbaspirillum humi TaxID=1688639 RepID=A0A239DPP1_9BURK|nr:glycoside hydrolase family 16 protein [Noviherbaspirillum humi]SNS33713.1 Glycosyl hydrolases family 16 [Noviherbaspirillum humi]